MTKSKPILFSAPMVKALLTGNKNQTRRIVKPQPEIIYRLTDANIDVIHNKYENKKWSDVETDSDFSESRLHGGRRWEDLFTDKIRGLWGEGLRGLVSACRMPGKRKIYNGFFVPQEQENHSLRSSSNMYGLSRNAESYNASNKTSGRQSQQQCAIKSSMGNTAGSMAGCQTPRNIARGGETLGIQAEECGEASSEMGYLKGALQPELRRINIGNDFIWNIRSTPFVKGGLIYVKETFRQFDDGNIFYKADFGDSIPSHADDPAKDWRWKPSIFMPRAASRITLRVTEVRCERLQDIDHYDCEKEGLIHFGRAHWSCPGTDEIFYEGRDGYRWLWESINGKGSWSLNPYVFCYTFVKL